MAAYSQYFLFKTKGMGVISIFLSVMAAACWVQAATFSDIFLFRLLRKEKLKTALLFL
jgi:hypothetical protein